MFNTGPATQKVSIEYLWAIKLGISQHINYFCEDYLYSGWKEYALRVKGWNEFCTLIKNERENQLSYRWTITSKEIYSPCDLGKTYFHIYV